MDSRADAAIEATSLAFCSSETSGAASSAGSSSAEAAAAGGATGGAASPALSPSSVLCFFLGAGSALLAEASSSSKSCSRAFLRCRDLQLFLELFQLAAVLLLVVVQILEERGVRHEGLLGARRGRPRRLLRALRGLLSGKAGSIRLVEFFSCSKLF